MNILLTGSSGFIGKALVPALKIIGSVRCSVRSGKKENIVKSSDLYIIDDINSDTDWGNAIAGVDVVVHAAARAQVFHEANELKEFRKINVDGTLNLARQAARAGVKRFVFVSSVKVNGESTLPYYSFTENDMPKPLDIYGISKHEAELELLKLSVDTKMEVVIVRPPLVYGSGVKGNFANMCNWLRRGIPLPLGAVKNQRSLVALDNLVDFISLCVDYNISPKAANQVFLISDGVDVSTTQLLEKVAQAQGCSARLLPVPVSLMKWGARMLGKGEEANRLLGNLQVDSRKARDWLGWQPVITMEEQLEKMFSSTKDK